MQLVKIFEYIGMGGFIIWALMERTFTFTRQWQDQGEKQVRISYWLINLAWYGAIFFAILDVWTSQITTFAKLLLPLRALGASLIIAGLLIRFIARRDLGKQYSVHVETSADHQLVTHGIYQTIRHPAYLGLIGLFLGIPTSMGSWGGMAIAALAGIPVVLYRTIIEERYLSEWFGTSYQDYKNNTWRILPRIW